MIRVYTRIMIVSSCYCIKLRNASRRLTAIYDAALAPLGINVTQFSQLRRIRRQQPVSLTDLARQSDLDRSTVGRNAKVLERMGLVAAVPVTDHRETALALSERGEALLKDAVPIWEEVQARIENRLEADGLDRILAAIEDLE